MKELTDRNLVERTCQGEIAAFTGLVERYSKPLQMFCLRYVDDKSQAEDLVQESFLKAYEKLSTFRFQSSFKSWLYRIAINSAKNRLRKKRNFVNIENLAIAVECESEQNMIDAQLKLLVKKWVDGLPKKQRVALELRIYQELSFREVANQMKCPYDTAKANYRHGMLKIRGLMARVEQESNIPQ